MHFKKYSSSLILVVLYFQKDFGILIEELKQLLSKPAKGKGSKNKASSKADSERLEGTNAVTNEKVMLLL